MLTDHTKGLLLAWKLGKMKDEGTMNYNHVSVAKRENVRSALKAARTAREILGASGITLDYSVVRHMLNLETINTYKNTQNIHTLIIKQNSHLITLYYWIIVRFTLLDIQRIH